MINKQLIKQISATVDKNKERLIEICKRLIEKESVTGNEFEVQQEVFNIFEEINMETDMWQPDDLELRLSSLFSETNESFKNRPVVVGIAKGQNIAEGHSLMINGHVDVVSAEPLDKWKTSPFEAVIKEGRMYGRGASDMKTGLATAIFCTELLKNEFGGTNNDITIISVPGEENGGNGTVASILRGYNKADGAIYPEPTSNRIQPAHRGAAFWRIHIEGKASHGGTKYKGISAIEKGMKIVNSLKQLERERNENICSKNEYYSQYPISAPVTVGIFNGGQFTSAVPEYCMIEGCIEYVPGEKSAEVISSFEAAVERVGKDDKWLLNNRPRVEWFGLLYEPASTDANNPLVSMAAQCYEDMLGEKPIINGFEAGTDMRLLNNDFGVPGFMFGAGDIAMAHAPNEYVDIELLIKNAKVLALIMAKWCGIKKQHNLGRE